MGDIYDVFSNHVQALVHERNKILVKWAKEIVAVNCTPPIKGEITKGKTKWRGIRIIHAHDGIVYFSQRGKRISPILHIDFTIEY